MSLFAKRAQIIASYSGVLNALEPFPSTRDNYFLIGRSHEKKRKLVRFDLQIYKYLFVKKSKQIFLVLAILRRSV